jgi:SAM-dependent MidA family methyltransferase
MEGTEKKELLGIIRARLGSRGMIPFSEFMDLALYHPHHGYYSSSAERIGPEGDYYTSPHVHPIFGRLISRQLRQMWEILGFPSPFTIVEMGAGKGLLCADILGASRDTWPEFYRALVYMLAEISPVLREKQRSFLSSFEAEGKIEWVRPETLLKGKRPFSGCLLSNELIDAFPVHLVRQENGSLTEIYVAYQDGRFQEVPGPPSSPLIEEYFRLYGTPLEAGQRAEVNLDALEWLEGVSRTLQRGFVLTIDYGYEAAELYHPERREGTLLCYFRHTTSPDPYQRIGLQDITAHVNFTALMKKGESLGLRKAGCTEQYKFLAALGLLQELEDLEKKSRPSDPVFLKNKLAMRNFLIPGGMGTLFKVLAQYKGIELQSELLGFRDPFRPLDDPETRFSPDRHP